MRAAHFNTYQFLGRTSRTRDWLGYRGVAFQLRDQTLAQCIYILSNEFCLGSARFSQLSGTQRDAKNI